MTLLGYHIDGLDLRDQRTNLLAQVQRTKSNYHLVMDDKQFAKDLLPHVNKGVVVRSYDPFAESGRIVDFDNSFWTRHTPAVVVNWMKNVVSDLKDGVNGKHFYHTVGNNEPSSSRQNRRALIGWLTQLMHEAFKAGYRLAIGEIAVAKTLEIDEIEAGWWDEFLAVLYQYREWHILSIHEYSTGLLPASHMVGYPQNLLNKSYMQPVNWTTKIPDSRVAWIDPATQETKQVYPGNWHLGRVHWLLIRAREIGKPVSRFVVTEGSFDIMEDPAHKDWIVNELKPKFINGNFERMKGYEGHKPYWQWLLGKTDDRSWQEFMFQNYAWLCRAYAPEFDGVCMYSMNADWHETEGTDMSHPDIAYFRELVETIPITRNTTPVPTPTPVPTFTEIRVQSTASDGQNIRKSPDGDVVGKLPPPTATVLIQVSDAAPIDPLGLQWREIIYGSLRGWVAWKFVRVIDTPQVDYRAIAIEILEKVQEKLDSDIAQKIAQKMDIDRQLAALRNTA